MALASFDSCGHRLGTLQLAGAARHNQQLAGEVPDRRTVERQIGAGDHVLAQREPAERQIVAVPAVAGEEHHHADGAGQRKGQQAALPAQRVVNVLVGGGRFGGGGVAVQQGTAAAAAGGRIELICQPDGGEHVQQRARHEGDEDFLVDS